VKRAPSRNGWRVSTPSSAASIAPAQLVEQGVRRRKAVARRRHEIGRETGNRQIRRRDAERLGQAAHLPAREAARHERLPPRRQHAREFTPQPRAGVVGARRRHPPRVMHQVQAQLVERFVDEAGDETERRIVGDQRPARRRLVCGRAARERGRIVEDAPFVEDEERNEGILVQRVERRPAFDGAPPLAALDQRDAAQVLEAAPVRRQVAEGDRRGGEQRPQLSVYGESSEPQTTNRDTPVQ
jgi:hypothetical protein